MVDRLHVSPYPVVFSYVHALGPGERDSMSLRSLRNVRYPIDEYENQGEGYTLNYSSFGLTSGYWGNKLTFVIRPNPTSPALEFTQIAAVDANAHYQYVLTVGCSPDCFLRRTRARSPTY